MSKSADAFRTISEVADWLGVQTHVLRFWESKFTQVKPVKRAGGRRYYRPADMLLLGGIRKLLHEDGLTIKGVQKILREDGMAHVSDMSLPLDDDTTALLDGDLVASAPGPDELSAPAPDRSRPEDEDTEPSGIDQSPIKTLNAGPFSDDDDDDDGPDDDDENDVPSAPKSPSVMPSFMRIAEPEVPAPRQDDGVGQVRDTDIPTLTSDFEPDVHASAPQDTTSDTADMAADQDQITPTPLQDTPGPFDDGRIDDGPFVDDSSEDAPFEDSPSEDGPFGDTDADATPEPLAANAPAPTAAPQAPVPQMFQNFDAPAPAEPPRAEAPRPEPLSAEPVEPQLDAIATSPEQPEEPQAAAAPEEDAEAAVPAPPRPRIIDVPDDTHIDDAEIAPSVLTKATMLTHLLPAQRDAMRPLVAQLTALRDQMARARRDPG